MTEKTWEQLNTVDNLIRKYHDMMTEDPSTTNYYCNMFIKDLLQLKKDLVRTEDDNCFYMSDLVEILYGDDKIAEQD